MADQPARLEAATVRAEVGSNIVYRFANDAASAADIPTLSGEIPNLSKIILTIQQEGADKISFSTRIYQTTAAGIAATNDQEIFLVQTSDPDEIYAVWQNVAGTAVDTGKRSLSAAAVIAATQAASDAATAAQESADEATARVARFLAPTSVEPVQRDNGQPLEVGDQWPNSSNGLIYNWNGTAWVPLNESVQGLTENLASLNYGASIVYGASPQVFGFAKLKTTQPRYQGDRVDVVSHTFPFPASGPSGAMSFVWDASSTAAETPGTVSAVEGIAVGRWIFQGLEYRDVDFGATGEGDESALMQAMLDSVPSGATILITKKVKCNDLVCNANSIFIDSRSSAYFESPGLVAFAPSTKPLLTIGGYGWKVGTLWVEDGTVDAGVINSGSQGVVLKRADGKKDLDAYVYGLNVFKFETGLRKVGINCRTLGGGNIFSHCLDSIVTDQVSETVGGVSTLQDVRGIVVAGGARFHGRPASRISAGVTAAVAGSEGCDIVINGTVQRENMVQCNLADGSGSFFRGQLGRGCLLSDNVVRTPGGDAVTVTGGISGAIDGLTIAGGEKSGLVFTGGTDIPVNGLNIDTVFEFGVVLRNTLGVMLNDFKVQNVSAKPGATTACSGILIESTAVLTKVGGGRIKQSVITTGDVGVDNQGNQTYFDSFCDVIGFSNGPRRQSITQRAYGDYGLMSNRTLRMYLAAPPSEGTFGTGDRIINTTPNIANPVTTWIRTADGAWRVENFITYSGSTALRPILQSTWLGVMYFDTTLGKPIWWNSTWKDATGATV